MSGEIKILGVPGTWGKKRELEATQWYQKGSALYWYIKGRGFNWLIGRDGRVFQWDTGLVVGIWARIKRFFTRKKTATLETLIRWQVAGSNLYDFLCPTLVEPEHWMPACLTHLFLHSHGGNVGAFACSDGLLVNVFVTFETPVRFDMVEVWKRARPRIGFWIEVHAGNSDNIQRAGEAGDGHVDLNGVRSFNELIDPVTGKTFGELGIGPDMTIVVDDGHSGILNNGARFNRLAPILEIIKERHGREFFNQSDSAIA